VSGGNADRPPNGRTDEGLGVTGAGGPGPDPSGPPSGAGPDPWGRPGRRAWRRRRGPRHAAGFVGCLLLSLVLFVGLVATLATWLAGTVLGIVAPGAGASAPAALAVVVVIAAAVVVVGRVLGRAVGPLASIADAAERLADGEPDVRVEIAGPGQVRRLGASFNAMAERLDRSRSDRQALLADVTHELRTPLQVIGGSVEAMLDGVRPRDDAHLAPILAETAVMNRLLDDLRTVSLAEAGALPLHREEVDVRRLLADVASGHAAAAREAGVELAATAGPAILLDADPVRVREVVANLVVNAVRHTPPGGSIHLDAAVDGAWVELTVVDTGEGIAPADLDRIFDRFYRRADAGGSGLGLTIARDLVAAHGGTIRAESEGIPGRGTTVRVRLPRRG
jgi:two-component system sensor histidine kinase BaeS